MHGPVSLLISRGGKNGPTRLSVGATVTWAGLIERIPKYKVPPEHRNPAVAG